MKRTMTISVFQPPTQQPWVKTDRPFIRIANKYLEEFGFHIGDKIEVEYQPNQIIIKPAKKEQSFAARKDNLW